MKLFPDAQDIIDVELANIADDPGYDLQPERRIEIYCILGPSCIPDYRRVRRQGTVRQLPSLTTADRVRTRVAIRTAEKVTTLWESACRETDTIFAEHEDPSVVEREEKDYLSQKRVKHIEEISVYDVPRAFIPAHILEMAELALNGKVWNCKEFFHQSNEWWQIYPRPEQMERECFIKWAAQEALYEALGWVDDERIPPATDAVRAYAGIFTGDTFKSRSMTFDPERRRGFWRWWLSEAIPVAWRTEAQALKK